MELADIRPLGIFDVLTDDQLAELLAGGRMDAPGRWAGGTIAPSGLPWATR